MLQDFFDIMNRGTWWIMWTIFLIGVVIWSVGIDRALFLMRFGRARRRFIRFPDRTMSGIVRDTSTGNVHYDWLLGRITSMPGITRTQLKHLYREFMASALPQLNAGFSTITAWIYVAPLMGLLGTVIGMIKTFQIITSFGNQNPGLTAEGIAVALLTTQAGLIVAFPALVLQVLLTNRRRQLSSLIRKDMETCLARVADGGAHGGI